MAIPSSPEVAAAPSLGGLDLKPAHKLHINYKERYDRLLILEVVV